MVVTTKEALELLQEAARKGRVSADAVETVTAAIMQLGSLANRVIDAGVTRWHVPHEEIELIEWLEISRSEYSDWIQKSGIFGVDFTPYRIDDDEAVLRAYNAVRNMYILRTGDQHDHAQAFREALIVDSE